MKCSIRPAAFEWDQAQADLPHSGLLAGQNCSPLVFEDRCRTYHFRADNDFGLWTQHLKRNRSDDACLCSSQQLRIHVALHRRSVLVRQHACCRCRVCACTEVHHHVLRSGELSQQVSHPRHVLLLRRSHRRLPSSCGVLIQVQHLLLWPLRNAAHHVCPVRVLRRSLASCVLVDHLQRPLLCQSFSPERDGRFGQGCAEEISTAKITIGHPRTFRVGENLVFYFEDVRKPFVRLLRISLHILYHLRLPTEASVLMEEHQLKTENVTVCSRSHRAAHDFRSALDVFFVSEIVSGACLSPRIASAVRKIGQHQAFVLVQSSTRLQLMQAIRLIERSMLGKAVLLHGYHQKLESRLGFLL